MEKVVPAIACLFVVWLPLALFVWSMACYVLLLVGVAL